MKKKLLAVFTFALALIALCACNSQSKEEETFVSLDINPSIELIVNSENVVTKVYATNDDAKALLYDETIEGKKFDDAIACIVELSIEYGYLSEENKVIEYTMTSESEKTEEKLTKVINSKVSAIAEKSKLEIKVDNNVTFTIDRHLDELKKQYSSNLEIQGLSGARYKLIVSAMEADNTLTIEAALELSNEELINKIKESRDEFYNIATKKYTEAIAKQEMVYQRAFNTFSRNVYSAYYMAHMMEHPVNYGAIYALYGQVADTFDDIILLSTYLDNYELKVLSEEQVEKIVNYLTELGVKVDEALECLKDEEGNITIDSVNAYLNKVIKNIENKNGEVISQIKNILNQIDIEITIKENDQIKNYHVDIETVLEQVKNYYNQLKLMVLTVSSQYKEIIDAYIAELDELISVIESAINDSISIDQLKAWTKQLRTKEEQLFNKIQNDLSSEELKQIDNLLANIDSSIKNAKDELNNTIKNTKLEVENALKEHKNSHKQ